MLTVTQLARKYDISRTTILYYEREGLLMPHTRSENGYRWYGQTEVKRLEAIMAYRAFGIPVSNIAPLLNREDDREQERILRDQLMALENEIQKLRHQQKAIVLLLKQPSLLIRSKEIRRQRFRRSSCGLQSFASRRGEP